MQVTVDRGELIRAFSLVSTLCRAKQKKSQPWEWSFLLRVSSSGIEALSTSLDVAVAARVEGPPSRSRASEALLVPKKAGQLLRKLAGDRVTVRTLKRSIRFLAGGSSATVKCEPAFDFPEYVFDDRPRGESFEVGAVDFRAALGVVLQSVCADFSRPMFCGVSCRVVDGLLVLASTDGKRLSETRLPVDGARNVEPFTLPERAASAAYRTLADASGGEALPFIVGSEQITLRLSPGVSVHAKPTPLAFPDYEGLIPSRFAFRFRVELSELKWALQAVAPFAPDESAQTPGRMLIEKRRGAVSFSAGDSVGEIDVEVEGDWSGPEASVAFDVRYLRSWAARVASGDHVEICVSGPRSPGLFRAVEREDLRCVIMPMC